MVPDPPDGAPSACTHGDMVGHLAGPGDDCQQALHHAAVDQRLASGLVAGQVVQEREQRRRQHRLWTEARTEVSGEARTEISGRPGQRSAGRPGQRSAGDPGRGQRGGPGRGQRGGPGRGQRGGPGRGQRGGPGRGQRGARAEVEWVHNDSPSES